MTRFCRPAASGASALARSSAIERARSMSSTTKNLSPATGSSFRPLTITGVLGPASWIISPLVVEQAADAAVAGAAEHRRRRPSACRPARARSRPRRGPDRIVDSMTVPRAGAVGSALSSRSCDCRSRISISSWMPWPVMALVRMTSVSPPHSTGFRPLAASWPSTMSGLASGRSILFIATTIGTSAAWRG